jgi:hypothetical protein
MYFLLSGDRYYIYWVQLSRFHLMTEMESNLLNTVLNKRQDDG